MFYLWFTVYNVFELQAINILKVINFICVVASRKQFMALARKFFSRKKTNKRTLKQMYPFSIYKYIDVICTILDRHL